MWQIKSTFSRVLVLNKFKSIKFEKVEMMFNMVSNWSIHSGISFLWNRSLFTIKEKSKVGNLKDEMMTNLQSMALLEPAVRTSKVNAGPEYGLILVSGK